MGNNLRWTPDQLADFEERRGRWVPKPAIPSPVESPPFPTDPGTPKKTKALRLSRDRKDSIAQYLQQLDLAGIPAPVTEFRFCPARRWRSDFAWPEQRVLVEYEGGIFKNGRHTRGRGYESDCEKYSIAAIMGFIVIRITVNIVKSGLALQLTEQALAVHTCVRGKP